MGMFDNVSTPEIKCPKCDHIVTGFQSKDLDCLLDTVDFKQVDNFYCGCGNCGHWLSFNRKNDVPDNYLELHFELNKDGE